MTILRLAIALVFSLALHAALAAVLGENVDMSVAGTDPQSTAVTLVLIETQSDSEEEAAPSPEPGTQETFDGGSEPVEPVDTAPQMADARPEPTKDVKAEPEAAIQDNAVRLDERVMVTETAQQDPTQVAALPLETPSPTMPDPLTETGPRVDVKAEPTVDLPETLAVIPRSRPVPDPSPARVPRKKDNPRAKQATPKAKTGNKAARQTSPGSGGQNSIGNGKQVSARSSARAVAAYGRRVNAHVARRKPASSGRGTVALTIRVNRAGKLIGASLASSSGNPSLDQVALVAARKAAPYPAPPDNVPGSTIALRIRLSFR